MLAADKLQLQSQLKQQATALKEKEFNLHHSNFMTVGTQAAVLAGLDITMFIEFNPPHNNDWGEDMIMFPRLLKFFYYITILSAFCANMIVVSHTTALSVLGAGMALRGPDGSMMTATDGLYEERKSVFAIFGFGLACTVGSVVICVWIMLQWEAALCCMTITLLTGRTIWRNYQRVQQRFDFDESQTVDFRDIMEGPAAIRGVPSMMSALYNKKDDRRQPRRRQQRNEWPKTTSSIPVGMETRENSFSSDDDVEWNSNSTSSHQKKRLLDSKNASRLSMKQRRGRSTSPPESFIQTV